MHKTHLPFAQKDDGFSDFRGVHSQQMLFGDYYCDICTVQELYKLVFRRLIKFSFACHENHIKNICNLNNISISSVLAMAQTHPKMTIFSFGRTAIINTLSLNLKSYKWSIWIILSHLFIIINAYFFVLLTFNWKYRSYLRFLYNYTGLGKLL